MARYIADVRFIASIYPGELQPIRRNYGPTLHGEGKGACRSTNFKLKPVKRGEDPFVLPIYDSFEELINFSVMSSMGGGGAQKKPRISNPVDVDSIVRDLLKEWTGGLFNVPAGAMPGVIEIRPMKVDVDKFSNSPKNLPVPNKYEMEQMLGQQTKYMEFLFTEGERHHSQNNWKEITDTMRLAADWLGYEREWSHHAIARDSGPCPACTKIIPSAAIFCPFCHQQIRALSPELMAVQQPQAAAAPTAK